LSTYSEVFLCYIDIWFLTSSCRDIKFITNVYGPQQLSEKIKFLHQLQHTSDLVEQKLWIIEGDFNLISYLEEIKKGVRRLESDNEAFNTFIQHQRLIDIETTNGLFTWNNRWGGYQ
jgi:hypothetical protein